MGDDNRKIIRHSNGQTTAYILDSFVDPWKPAETILLQHGFGRTSDHFYHWVPALARKYNVLRRDLRGHGGSSYPGPDDDEVYQYTTATIVDEIKETLDQLNIEKVHFVGESTSGMLAEIFAATYPERVNSIIVCSSPTRLPASAQQFLAFGLESWPQACRQLGSRGWAERLLGASGTVASSDPNYLAWWKDKVAVSDGEGLAGYAEFLSQLDAQPYLGDIKASMLILSPTNSALVSVESMKKLAGEIASSKLEIIESQGHEIYAEAAENCISKIEKFLQEL